MTIEEIYNICRKLKGASQDIKWNDHICFHVGKKIFLITSPDMVPQSASFKVKDKDFEGLSVQEGFAPAPYLARYNWVHIDDINRLSNEQWKYYARQSYQLIASRLPANIKRSI